MTAARGSGLELLEMAADALDASSLACDDPGDGRRLSGLAARIRDYLASSRPSTPVGMPRIVAESGRSPVGAERAPPRQSHVRMVDGS